MARIVLGDHHVLFLDALSAVLANHGYETGTVARSTSEMVALVRGEQPALCLVDPHRAAGDGDDGRIIQIVGQVLAASCSTRVLVLSADPASEMARRAVEAGASGYLHQSQGIGELTDAIERVLRGEIVTAVPPLSPQPRPAESDLALLRAAGLTCRERQCLMMLVDGLDTVAITRQLDVSRTTARTHLQSVLTKLGVHSRLEAVSFAVRHRLPDLWPEAGLPAAPEPVQPVAPSWQHQAAASGRHLAARLGLRSCGAALRRGRVMAGLSRDRWDRLRHREDRPDGPGAATARR